MCDLSLGSPAWGKAMPTGSPSSSCYFWRWSPCSWGCLQTPMMVSPLVTQDSLKNHAQGWVLQSSSRWNCLLKCLRERNFPTWPYTGNGDGENTHTHTHFSLLKNKWRLLGIIRSVWLWADTCVCMQLSRDLGEAQGHQKKHNTFHHSVVLSFKGKTLNMVKWWC